MNVNKYGLVPGKALKNFDVFRAGQLCGFEPAIAQRLRQKGVWRPTNDAAVAAADANIEAKAIEDAGDEGSFLVGLETGTLKVPHNWRDQHHTKKKAWATQIAGKDVTTVPESDEVIASAVKDQEAALSASE